MKTKALLFFIYLAFMSFNTQAKSHEFKDSVFKVKTFVGEFGEGNKESVLLVHGLGDEAAKDWDDVIPKLSQSYHLIRVELPGFGRSEKSKKEFYTPENFAKFLNEIVNKFAIDKKVILVGHSLGGAISLTYVSLFPETVRKLILIDAAGILQRSVFTRSLAQLSLKKGDSMFSSIYNKTVGLINGVTGAVLDFGDKFASIQDILMSSGELRSLLAKDKTIVRAAIALIETNYATVFPMIKVPTLILWGNDDPIAPLRTGILLERQIRDTTLIIYPKIGHVPMKENSESVIRDISSWLSKPIMVPKVVLPIEEKNLKKYVCENKQGIEVSGSYGEMIFNNCQNVSLSNVSATSLKLNETSLIAINLEISSDNFALEMKESTLQVTNFDIKSRHVFKLDSSKLDLAGANINYKNKFMDVNGKSIIWWSVGRSQKESSDASYHHKTSSYQ